MKYVLDASVALNWVLPEPDTPRAVRLRNAYRQKLHELLAPDIFPAEVAHALTRAERRGILTRPEGARRLLLVLRTAPLLHPYLPLLRRAVDISSSSECPSLAEDRPQIKVIERLLVAGTPGAQRLIGPLYD